MMIDMVIGDKEHLALEILESSEFPDSGVIYLYVNNNRFGYDEHEFDLDSSVDNVIKYFKVRDFDTRNLKNCPPAVLFSAFDKCFFEEIDSACLNVKSVEEFDQDEIDYYYPGFYSAFLNQDNLDSCIFRYGHYIFDGYFLVLIPFERKLRLLIRNNSTSQIADATTTESEFLNLWREASVRVQSSKHT